MVYYNIQKLLVDNKIIQEVFHGKVTLVFEYGKITYIRKEETIQISKKKPKSGG